MNEALRFYDERIGQSTTLSGRSVARHMNSEINRIITGIYDHTGEAVCYSDTDSVFSGSIINTNHGDVTIEHLFFMNDTKWIDGEKEYSRGATIKVKSYDPKSNQIVYKSPDYVYRHKTKKPKWKITDSNGDVIIVTGDHSVMVDRNGIIVEIKPENLEIDDILIKTK